MGMALCFTDLFIFLPVYYRQREKAKISSRPFSKLLMLFHCPKLQNQKGLTAAGCYLKQEITKSTKEIKNSY